MAHQLPPLPYPANALEPFIDEQTMMIHYARHHNTLRGQFEHGTE